MKNQEKHPLLKRNIKHFSSHDEWLVSFNKATNAEEILGLLHCGLNRYLESNNVKFSDIVILYFQYAYGYADYSYFQNYNEEEIGYFQFGNNGKEITLPTLRREISKKALHILCQKFLKNENIPFGSENPLWWILTIQESDNGVLDEIIRFFSHNRNLPALKSNDNNIKILREFLYKLSISAWLCQDQSKSPSERELEEIPKCLIKYREKFIGFLWHLDKLDFLVKNWALLYEKDFETIKSLANNLKDHMGKISFKEALSRGYNIAICYNTLREIRIIFRYEESLDIMTNKHLSQ